MVYLALIEGAKGIWWYSMCDPGWDLTTTPLWLHLKTIQLPQAARVREVLSGAQVGQGGERFTEHVAKTTARIYRLEAP